MTFRTGSWVGPMMAMALMAAFGKVIAAPEEHKTGTAAATSAPAPDFFKPDHEETWDQVQPKLAKLSDDDLESLTVAVAGQRRRDKAYDFCLTEIVRRGGARWEAWLLNREKTLAQDRETIEEF